MLRVKLGVGGHANKSYPVEVGKKKCQKANFLKTNPTQKCAETTRLGTFSMKKNALSKKFFWMAKRSKSGGFGV